MNRALSALLLAALFACAMGLACVVPPGIDMFQEHFTLQGKHTELSCADCHGDVLEAEPTACAGCHEGDRPAAHSGDRLGECGSCHSEAGWQYAVDDHSFLPLEFGHSITCDSCHADLETFSGLEGATCLSCHSDDTPRADHYPGQECSDCHNTVSWDDIQFDHDDFFPTPHEGVRECASCHVNDDNYQTFECIECHEHSQQRMDDEHRGETNNYRWESQACLDCHPQGRE